MLELSQWLGLPPKKLRSIRLAAHALRRLTHSSIGAEDGPTLDQTLHDQRTPAPDERAGKADELHAVRQLLDRIDSREAEVLRLRFGLNRPKPMTLDAIGTHLGVTRERVRQLQAKALRTLKNRLLDNKPLSAPDLSRGTDTPMRGFKIPVVSSCPDAVQQHLASILQ